jgi:hypothetical protein
MSLFSSSNDAAKCDTHRICIISVASQKPFVSDRSRDHRIAELKMLADQGLQAAMKAISLILFTIWKLYGGPETAPQLKFGAL